MLLLSICACTSLLQFEEVYYSFMHDKEFPQLRHHVISLGMQTSLFPMQYELNKHTHIKCLPLL